MNFVPIQGDRLIIFTRYPEPGKTKTRLIPALGAEGAADLHRQLAERTLACARELANRQSLSVEVQFAGGESASHTLRERQRMQDWLGSANFYQPQSQGDLGDRMAKAFQNALDAGVKRAVIVGTDCPGMDAQQIADAFEQLHQHDLVLGPAADGGYYLIGLSRFIPQLFREIRWSSSLVLQQTIAIARSLDLSYSLLPCLADIDRPEDLAILEPSFQIQIPQSQISIIVPTLNEASIIQQTLACAQLAANVEAIVVDGGSQDNTEEVARSMGVKVISTPAGRARQMNAGASAALGEILLFLHADTQLPVGFDARVREALAQKDVVAGAFELQIDSSMPLLRLIEAGVNGRSRIFQMPYGDQAIFMKASAFERVGGFPEIAIMEDFELIRRLRRLGKINIIPMPVLTSARRWQKLGVLKTTLANQLVIIAYFLGISPERLARWYRRDRGTS